LNSFNQGHPPLDLSFFLDFDGDLSAAKLEIEWRWRRYGRGFRFVWWRAVNGE